MVGHLGVPSTTALALRVLTEPPASHHRRQPGEVRLAALGERGQRLEVGRTTHQLDERRVLALARRGDAGAQRLGHGPLHRDQRGDRPGREQLGVPVRLGQQVVGLADPPDQAHLLRLRGRDPLGRQQHPGGVLASDEPGEEVRRRRLRGHAQAGEGALQPGGRRHERQVGEAEHRRPDAEPDAVDRADERLREVGQRVDQAGEPVLARARSSGSVAMLCISSRSVPALKPRPLPVSSTTATSGVVGRVEQRVGSGVVQLLVEGVERLGPVEGERPDPVAVVDLQRHGSNIERVLASVRSRTLAAWTARSGCGGPTGRARSGRSSVPIGAGPATRRTRTSASGTGAACAPRRPGDPRDRGAARRRRSCTPRRGGPARPGLLESVPALLGAEDDVDGFEPRHPMVDERWRRYPHARLGRSGLLMEALVPAIIEQKVTGQEAFAGFRMLVHRYGERAPGPGADAQALGAADADAMRTIPSWEWLRMHVDPARSRTIVTAARVADSLERTVGLPGDEVDRRLRSLPGIGVWTAAEVRQRAHGDPDAVSFGDYHLAKLVGWAVPGSDFDDAEMEQFLEPWRPHRGRAALSVGMAGRAAPARAPDGAAHPPAHPRLAFACRVKSDGGAGVAAGHAWASGCGRDEARVGVAQRGPPGRQADQAPSGGRLSCAPWWRPSADGRQARLRRRTQGAA